MTDKCEWVFHSTPGLGAYWQTSCAGWDRRSEVWPHHFDRRPYCDNPIVIKEKEDVTS